MKHKYYINKLKHVKQLKIAIIIGLSGLVALVLINMVCYYLTGRVLNSFLLGGAVFFSLISLYRTIFLIKLPVIIIDDESVSYFNVLWYNKYYWDKFELAKLDPNQHTLSIGLRNGRVYDKFLLNSLSDEDVELIIKHFETRNKLYIKNTLSADYSCFA